MGRGLDGLISRFIGKLCSFEGPPEGPPRAGRRSRAISGGYCVGETPLPIPNRAVKPHSADGTWPSRAWESRSPPVLPRQPPTGRLGVVRRAFSLLERLSGAFASRACSAFTRRLVRLAARGLRSWRGLPGSRGRAGAHEPGRCTRRDRAGAGPVGRRARSSRLGVTVSEWVAPARGSGLARRRSSRRSPRAADPRALERPLRTAEAGRRGCGAGAPLPARAPSPGRDGGRPPAGTRAAGAGARTRAFADCRARGARRSARWSCIAGSDRAVLRRLLVVISLVR